MGHGENIFEGIIAIIFLSIFASIILPQMNTLNLEGVSTLIFSVALFLIILGIIGAIIKLFGGRHGFY